MAFMRNITYSGAPSESEEKSRKECKKKGLCVHLTIEDYKPLCICASICVQCTAKRREEKIF